MTAPPDQPPLSQPPPRAFTQGVGTVFQIVGVTFFLNFFFICCFSALLSKDFAMRTDLGTVGWGDYTAQRALSVSMVVGVGLGLALAAIGLGLQAQRRRSPAMACAVTLFGAIFWLIHSIFFAMTLHSVLFSLLAAGFFILFAALFAFSLSAAGEMRRTPPPTDFEVLPADYKIPYSHLHQDPPEVRLAKELEERRRKLEVQQKELEMLEQKLHRKLDEKRDQLS